MIQYKNDQVDAHRLDLHIYTNTDKYLSPYNFIDNVIDVYTEK